MSAEAVRLTILGQDHESKFSDREFEALCRVENLPFAMQWGALRVDEAGENENGVINLQVFGFSNQQNLAENKLAGTESDFCEIFPWASVTKLAMSLGIWIAIEQGLLDLDDTPAGLGLNQTDLEGLSGQGQITEQAFTQVADMTVADLLSHTSGLGFDLFKRVAKPGKKRVYSNAGFDLLGLMLKAVSSQSAAQWLESEIFMPLGMDSAVLLPPEYSPAFSGASNLIDLARLAAEFLKPTLISQQALAFFTAPYLPGLPGILPGYGRQNDNLWSLGAELHGQKNPHWQGEEFPSSVFGHFGQSGSFLWVDREEEMAGIFLGSAPFGSWHKANWPMLTSVQKRLARA